jgi:maleate isomerase
MTRSFPYRAGASVAHRARLGLVVLQSDETLEYDLRRLLPDDGVAVHISRVPNSSEVTSATLKEMAKSLTHAASLLPGAEAYNVVGYGCTSASAVIGTERIAALIKDGCRTGAITEPVSALIAACRALGLRRLAFLTPYIEEVSATLRERLAEADIETPQFGSFNESDDAVVARIDSASVIAAATELHGRGGCDGIFMSCTNLQTLDLIAGIEEQCGCPVLSSNLVLGWHMMSCAGLRSPRPETASLLRGAAKEG